MDLIYIDESGDDVGGTSSTKNFALTAISVPEKNWKVLFDALKTWRKDLRDRHGIYLRSELHASHLLRRGGKLSSRPIPEHARAQIIREALRLLEDVGASNGVWVTNALFRNTPHNRNYPLAIERLINRLNTTLETKRGEELDLDRDELAANLGLRNRYAVPNEMRDLLASKLRRGVLVFDDGHEKLVRTVSRRMQVFNPIPSRLGGWSSGSFTRNIPPDLIVGDPFSRISSTDMLIQLADFVAFSLLKSEEQPTPRVKKFRLHTAFNILDRVLNRKATAYDAKGIIRR